MGEIKFRYRLKGFHNKETLTRIFTIEEIESHDFSSWHENYEVLSRDRFTGRKNKDGKDIYEGNIFRVEEDSNDDIFYIIICWIQEWCMFTTLHSQEYKDYLEQGVNVLDKSLFWTYTLEDTDDRRYFLCGNIHDNPELLIN